MGSVEVQQVQFGASKMRRNVCSSVEVLNVTGEEPTTLGSKIGRPTRFAPHLTTYGRSKIIGADEIRAHSPPNLVVDRTGEARMTAPARNHFGNVSHNFVKTTFITQTSFRTIILELVLTRSVWVKGER
eukprot:scaffold1276_cov162-Amphora_coffeaeformis.AAC.17